MYVSRHVNQIPHWTAIKSAVFIIVSLAQNVFKYLRKRTIRWFSVYNRWCGYYIHDARRTPRAYVNTNGGQKKVIRLHPMENNSLENKHRENRILLNRRCIGKTLLNRGWLTPPTIWQWRQERFQSLLTEEEVVYVLCTYSVRKIKIYFDLF